MKRFGRSGWFKESHRHALAARGIKTNRYMAQGNIAERYIKFREQRLSPQSRQARQQSLAAQQRLALARATRSISQKEIDEEMQRLAKRVKALPLWQKYVLDDKELMLQAAGDKYRYLQERFDKSRDPLEKDRLTKDMQLMDEIYSKLQSKDISIEDFTLEEGRELQSIARVVSEFDAWYPLGEREARRKERREGAEKTGPEQEGPQEEPKREEPGQDVPPEQEAPKQEEPPQEETRQESPKAEEATPRSPLNIVKERILSKIIFPSYSKVASEVNFTNADAIWGGLAKVAGEIRSRRTINMWAENQGIEHNKEIDELNKAEEKFNVAARNALNFANREDTAKVTAAINTLRSWSKDEVYEGGLIDAYKENLSRQGASVNNDKSTRAQAERDFSGAGTASSQPPPPPPKGDGGTNNGQTNMKDFINKGK